MMPVSTVEGNWLLVLTYPSGLTCSPGTLHVFMHVWICMDICVGVHARRGLRLTSGVFCGCFPFKYSLA